MLLVTGRHPPLTRRAGHHGSCSKACYAAQADEAGLAFWMQLVGRALMQVSAASEPLLPWLADTLAPGGVQGVMVFLEPAPVINGRLALLPGSVGVVPYVWPGFDPSS